MTYDSGIIMFCIKKCVQKFNFYQNCMLSVYLFLLSILEDTSSRYSNTSKYLKYEINNF